MSSEGNSPRFNHFEAILETISNEIVVFDADGKFIYGNGAAKGSGSLESLLKEDFSLGELYRNVEFRGVDGNIIPPEDYPSAKARKGIATRGNIFQFINKKAGWQRWYETNATPLFDASGKVSFVVISYQDVTQKRYQEEKLKLLVDAFRLLSGTLDFGMLLRTITRLMVPTLADWSAIDILDEGGILRRLTVAHQNPEMIKLVHSVDELFPPDPNAPTGTYHVVKTAQAEFIPEITDDMVAQAVKNDDQLKILRKLNLFSMMILPIRARGAVLGTLTLVHAESKRRYTPEDLEFVSDFCNHIGILLDNAKLYQEIEAENETKERFLAVLSHELRNPLAPIKNSLEIMKMKHENPAPDSEIAIIEHQFDHLAKLLQDLLDMNRLIHGRYELKRAPTELNALLGTVITTVEFMTKKKNIDLSLSVPPYETWIMIDPVRIEQVLINLLHNAEKFTPVGGTIRVTLQQKKNMAVIKVVDNGIGIEKKDIGKIFDMYFQGVRPDTYTSGLGMGLLLAREIVMLHGGTIEAESDGQGSGSTFTIQLPFANAPEATAGAKSDTAVRHDPLLPKKILVVDDNHSAADSLAKLLRLIGYRAETAYAGQEGLGVFRHFAPDIAIIDLGMADLNGYEVAKTLRAMDQTKIPLIALSGYGMDEDIDRALQAGFDRHLTKPAGLNELKEILQAYDL